MFIFRTWGTSRNYQLRSLCRKIFKPQTPTARQIVTSRRTSCEIHYFHLLLEVILLFFVLRIFYPYTVYCFFCPAVTRDIPVTAFCKICVQVRVEADNCERIVCNKPNRNRTRVKQRMNTKDGSSDWPPVYRPIHSKYIPFINRSNNPKLIYIYIHIYTHTHPHIYIYIHSHTHIHTYIYIYI